MDQQQSAATAFKQVLTALRQLLIKAPGTQLSEADTKANFVEKYVAALGYEGLEDVVREYFVKTSGEYVDYVLRVDGKPVLAIEAKKLDVDLTDKHAAQLIQYCAIEGIEWCALTNARRLWLYNTFLKGDQFQKLVTKLELVAFASDAEFGALFDQLWLLSRSNMAAPETITAWMEQRRLDRGLRMLLTDPRSPAVQALVQAASSAAGVSTTSDAVVQWVKGHLVDLAPASATPVPTPPYQPRKPPPGAGPAYWIMPAGPGKDKSTPVEQLQRWLKKGFWGFGKSTPNRQKLQQGDYVCFYAKKVGFVATARIAGPADAPLSTGEYPNPYPMPEPVYKVPLKDIAWLPAPRSLTKAVAAAMQAFDGDGDFAKYPGFLVQTTRRITAHDFSVITGQPAT